MNAVIAFLERNGGTIAAVAGSIAAWEGVLFGYGKLRGNDTREFRVKYKGMDIPVAALMPVKDIKKEIDAAEAAKESKSKAVAEPDKKTTPVKKTTKKAS